MTQREFHAACMKLLQRVACDRRHSGTDARIAILLLTKYANHKYECAWPSRETLARDLGVRPSTVTRALASLERGGYFAVQHNKGRGRTNLYVPLFADQEKDTPLRPFRGRVGDGEKGAAEARKGRSPRAEKGAALQQDLTKETNEEPLKGFASLASPPEGGERCSPNQESPCLKLPALSMVLNRDRVPMKSLSYWKDRARSEKAAKMTPSERERFWLELLDEDAEPS